MNRTPKTETQQRFRRGRFCPRGCICFCPRRRRRRRDDRNDNRC